LSGLKGLVGQERVRCLLDEHTDRYAQPRHRGYPYHRYRQPERVYPDHQERLPGIQDPDMCGTPNK